MSKHQAIGRLLRGVLAGGQARVLMCDTTAMAQAAMEDHHASRVCTAALGRGISAAALLTAAAEEETNSLTLTLSGGGPAGKLVVAAHGRRLKAYVDNPQATLPTRDDGKLDVGGALGRSGTVTVVRDLGLREPYVGQCPLQSGEVGEDVAYYCALSEQQPTLCSLGVLVADRVVASGGLLVQPLPGCDEAVLSALELRAPIYADISHHLQAERIDALFPQFSGGWTRRCWTTNRLSMPAIARASAWSGFCCPWDARSWRISFAPREVRRSHAASAARRTASAGKNWKRCCFRPE